MSQSDASIYSRTTRTNDLCIALAPRTICGRMIRRSPRRASEGQGSTGTKQQMHVSAQLSQPGRTDYSPSGRCLDHRATSALWCVNVRLHAGAILLCLGQSEGNTTDPSIIPETRRVHAGETEKKRVRQAQQYRHRDEGYSHRTLCWHVLQPFIGQRCQH